MLREVLSCCENFSLTTKFFSVIDYANMSLVNSAKHALVDYVIDALYWKQDLFSLKDGLKDSLQNVSY